MMSPIKGLTDIHHMILYMYSQIQYPKNVTTHRRRKRRLLSRMISKATGTSSTRNSGSPGTSLPATTIRAAVFRVFKRAFVNDQTLEPTQVAGFNQFFFDADGTRSWRYGAAIDQKFSGDIFGGVEYSQRDLDVPYETPFLTFDHVDWKERLGRAYLFWTPHKWVSLSAEYQYERFDRDQEFSFGIEEVKTHRVPLGLGFFHPSGIFFRLKETYFNQKGDFQSQLADAAVPGSDSFWITDASIGYRLPKRYGIFSVDARNLFDKSFRYQDTDPVSPVLQPVRSVVFKLTLAL